MLPGIPSWEVLREARRLRPGIKIILMSAYSRQYVRRYFEGVAIDGFLEKPFVLGDVLGLLRETSGKDELKRCLLDEPAEAIRIPLRH